MAPDELLQLMAARTGHFRYESGHHGDLWLTSERVFLRPDKIKPLVARLAHALEKHQPQAICGPHVGGAFLAQLLAAALDVEFLYAERHEGRAAPPGQLFPVTYRLPISARSTLRGKRIAIVDDVINAGSAVAGTLEDLRDCGAAPVAIAALLTLGNNAADLATLSRLPLETLAHHDFRIWPPAACPLCASKIPVEDPLA